MRADPGGEGVRRRGAVLIRKIYTWPEDQNLLHTLSVPFTGDQATLDELVEDLFDTMYDAGGIGISAIQIGVPVRVFVMEATGRDHVFVNPTITLMGARESKNEGCLSLPGILEMVERHPECEVKYLDRGLEQVVARFKDLEAQVIQHEMEHLEGFIIPDKLSATRRDAIRRELRRNK